MWQLARRTASVPSKPSSRTKAVAVAVMVAFSAGLALGREVRPDYFMLLTSAVAFIVTVIFALFGNGVWRARWGR